MYSFIYLIQYFILEIKNLLKIEILIMLKFLNFASELVLHIVKS